MVNSAVTFCVGGAFFTTLQDTLAKEPSCRLSMMARGALPCSRDSQGVIFIDRDPKHFQSLLNFMRDGWALLPSSSSPDERTELLHEIRYYQLSSMESWIRTHEIVHNRPPPSPSPSSSSHSSLATKLNNHLAITNSPHGEANTTISNTTAINPYSPGFTTRAGYQPTVAYTGLSPSRRALFSANSNVQQVNGSSSGLVEAAQPQGGGGGGGGFMATPQGKNLSASSSTNAGGEGGGGIRATFIQATMASPAPTPAPSYALPPPPPLPPTSLSTSVIEPVQPIETSAGKWTAKYLRTHEGLRDIANTIMELAYLPPHRSLHAGKVDLKISSECRHDRPSSLLSLSTGIHASPATLPLTVSVKSSSGWSFLLDLKPGSTSDPDLARKYNIGEAVQENWFVLCAVLKDQFGVLMEEQSVARPTCPACKRSHLAVTLHKIY